MTCFILTNGSVANAAQRKLNAIILDTWAIVYKIDLGAMHHMGKLTLARFNLPLSIDRPTCDITDLSAFLNS